MQCIGNITVVVDVFTEILIYRLRSSFFQRRGGGGGGGNKARTHPHMTYYRTPIVVKTADRSRATYVYNYELLFNYHTQERRVHAPPLDISPLLVVYATCSAHD